MQNTKLVFVLGSGRSGTKMMIKLLAGVDHIEAHHEYVRDAYQRDAALYFMGRLSRQVLVDKLTNIYYAAAYYSEAEYFVDASNKLSWVVDVLCDAFPTAKFIHIVRDGRKVASSFYHKLSGHVYNDRCVKILQKWLDHSADLPMPPPPEEFWWTIPQKGQPFYEEFHTFDQFERCCYQWTESNRNILEALVSVSEIRQIRVKLEDLIASPDELARLLKFVEIPYDDLFMNVMQKPQHVYVPLDYPLNDKQRAQFQAIASEMMSRLDYDINADEYRVHY